MFVLFLNGVWQQNAQMRSLLQPKRAKKRSRKRIVFRLPGNPAKRRRLMGGLVAVVVLPTPEKRFYFVTDASRV